MLLRTQWAVSDIYRLPILIDSYKNGLAVTMATVAYHARWLDRFLSSNSGLLSSHGSEVRDETETEEEESQADRGDAHYSWLKSSQFHNSTQPQSILVTEAVAQTPSHTSIFILQPTLLNSHCVNRWNTDLLQLCKRRAEEEGWFKLY